MISLSMTTWIHLGRGVTRAAKMPIDGPPSPCEQCERVHPYADSGDRCRSLAWLATIVESVP